MGRRGHRCRCCEPLVNDPCLASCRPAGESRELTAINITLSASDYTVTVPTTAGNPAVQYTSTYLFPGSRYSGTFSLIPTVDDPTLFEYAFDDCGGCQAYLRYHTGRPSNNCRLETFFSGLFEPESQPAAAGNADSPACLASLGVRVFQQPEIQLTACASQNTVVAYGDRVAMQFVDGLGFFLVDKSLATAIVEDAESVPTLFSGVYLSKCDQPQDFFSDAQLIFSQAGTGPLPDVDNIVEAGDPTVRLTNVTTSYG